MNLFKRLFGRSAPAPQTAQRDQPTAVALKGLVTKLTSNREPDFLDGLREAVGRADSGDYQALEAIREAIRLRSGKAKVAFYKPAIVMTKGMDRYIEAKPKILELARRQALLEDPERSGDLISALNSMSDAQTMRGALHEIYAMGKPSEGYAFQLLFNELRCSARFRV
ncbi:MAG TPA: hypothetical protein VE263_09990 [Candidatus Angelobacter sp.]|nr:hypothetical protein [Candidatus Angelobacter sp.]